MTPTTTTHLEHLSLNGPIGFTAAIVIGVALLAVFGWALLRERSIIGPRLTILFWVLRGVAVAGVMWMLLAPKNVQVQKTTTRRAVAVVTDVSGSMRTTDENDADDLRWAVASLGGDNFTATRSVDKAIAALGVALKHLEQSTEAIKAHQPDAEVAEVTSAANDALLRSKTHLQSVTTSVKDGSKSRLSAGKIQESLDGPEFQAFHRLCRALSKNQTIEQKGWRESLPDLEQRIVSVRRSMYTLARHTVAEEADRIAASQPKLLADVQKQSRLGRAAAFIEHLNSRKLASLNDRADVRLGAFHQSMVPLANATPIGSALRAFSSDETETDAAPLETNLSETLKQLHRDHREQPLAAVFLLTDAAHNDRTDDPREAAATIDGTPVYVVPVGSSRRVRDVVLQSVSAPNVAMRNDDIVVEVRIAAHDCTGDTCIVQLLQDGQVIDFRNVEIDSEFAVRTVRFEQPLPEMGEQHFQIAVVPLKDELTEANNYSEFDVTVTRSDIKVLIADEYPRWEYRYLAQLFRRDNKVECDELLYRPRMIATGRRAESKTMPVTVDDWDQYDVVILGDLPPEHLPTASQESLAEYLRRRSGTLVMIAGRESLPRAFVDHPLAELLPVEQVAENTPIAEKYAFRVTEEGRDHHALQIGESEDATRIAWDFVNRYSPMHVVSPWRKPKSSAHTLIAAVPSGTTDTEAAAKNSAFLCWQPVGRGRVVYLSGPDTWRLRYLRGDRLHYRFWGQLLRWAVAPDLAAGTEFVRLRTGKSRYATGDNVDVTVQLKDAEGEPVSAEDLEIRVASAKDTRTAPLAENADVPGEYRAVFRGLDPGAYRVEPLGAAIDELQKDSPNEPAAAGFTIQEELPPEMLDTRCDRALAEQIANATGGQVLPPTAVEEILELTNLEPIVTEKIDTQPLWLEWKYLWIVFGCLQTEWAIRKWKGLS